MIYLTSDLHFGHDREFIWGARGFKSIQEMNDAYVARWNEKINLEDDVYVLGDLMLGDKSNIEYLKRLNGKLHIVFGNHDTNTRQQLYAELPNVVETAWAIKLDYRKYHFFMTHFPCMTGNLEKESLKQMTLNLYGHTHQTTNFFEDRPYMYHVGVDSHNGYPVLLDDIIEEMYTKVKECIDFLDVQSADVGHPAETTSPIATLEPLTAGPSISSSVYRKKDYKLNFNGIKYPDIDAYCRDCVNKDECPGPNMEDGCPPDKNYTSPRCYKCVYNPWNCGDCDKHGKCKTYRRDPPDGGFYG